MNIICEKCESLFSDEILDNMQLMKNVMELSHPLWKPEHLDKMCYVCFYILVNDHSSLVCETCKKVFEHPTDSVKHQTFDGGHIISLYEKVKIKEKEEYRELFK